MFWRTKNQPGKFPAAPSGHRGVALIVTLCILVLLTGAALAFFSRTLLNRELSHSNAGNLKSDFLARSALDIIVGELRNEIADPLYSTKLTGIPASSSNPVIYRPIASTDVLPQKLGVSLPDTIGAATLVKVSASGVGIRPDGSPTLVGSSVSIDTPSLSGQYISSTSWFGTGGPQLGKQSTMPTWLFLTKANSVQPSPALANAKDPTNANYVIGRFAYTVYDLGGQTDANVAGFPSSVASTTAGLKSAPAYDDLTQLELTSSNVSSLVKWRNPVTGVDAATFDEWATGLEPSGGSTNQALTIAQGGHLSIAAGDNAFLSRHDLINASHDSGSTGITTDSLGYLTHFSRSLTGPTFSPNSDASNDYDYLSNAETDTCPGANHNPNADFANVRYSNSSGSVTHYDDQGNSSSYSITSGDPLLQRRFSLAKIAWLQASEEGTATAQVQAAIQPCFGLAWDSTHQRWNYVGSTGTTIQSSIETLTQVAAEPTPREPNFFEILKAGILAGTVGVTGPNRGMCYDPEGPLSPVESNVDLQVLRIGANIIDSAETDNYPTVLALSFGGLPVEVAGVVDLPYPYDVTMNCFCTTTPTPPVGQSPNPPFGYLNNADMVLVPSFMNPHRPSDTPATSGPASVRFEIFSGQFQSIYFTYVAPAPAATPSNPNPQPQNSFLWWQNTINTDLTALPPIVIPSSQFDTFRSRPQPQTGSTNNLGSLVPYIVDPSISSMEGFLLESCENTPGMTGLNYVTGQPEAWPIQIPSDAQTEGTRAVGYNTQGMVFSMQYLARDGKTWKTYANLGGYEALPQEGLGGVGIDFYSGYPSNVFENPYGYMNLDPRTQRMSTGMGGDIPVPGLLIPTAPGGPPNQYVDHINQYTSMGTAGQIFMGYFPEGGRNLSANTPFGMSYVNTIDSDESDLTNLRPEDAGLDPTNHTANPYAQSSSNTQLITNSQSRPVILHRPYRSVAELGYVFRDTPWKTLSFFDSTSADGGLLDLFSVSDQPTMVAGLANLNTQQAPVLSAILNNSGQYSDGSTPLASIPNLVSTIGTYSFSSGTPTSNLPFNLGHFPAYMSSMESTPSSDAVTAASDFIKYHREGVVRALSQTTQSRTWNLLIDVVAQVGRYPISAQSLNDFTVEGEKRYWLSVAIDRYTDKIIDEQLEPADE